jgi:hypothetical protein
MTVYLDDITIPSDILSYPPDERPEFPTTCKTYKLSDMEVLTDLFGFRRIDGQYYPGPPERAFRFFPQVFIKQTNTILAFFIN